LIRSCFKWIF